MCSVNEQFSQIYDQYIEKIYRFVYLKVSSQDVAEDITSRVFMKGWEVFGTQGLDIKNPGAFLYKIARNLVIDYYRQKARTNVVSVEALPQLADNGTTVYDKAVLNSEIKLVKKAMNSLKKDYQDVLIWYYLDDMATSQIAKILDKKEGAVRVMLHRGLRDLKELIKTEKL